MNLRDMIKVLQIVAKYDEPSTIYCQADHDILHLPLMNDTQISEEDREELLSLGAFESSADNWAVYT